MEDTISKYIGWGWAIFPLVPGGKTPATKNGFKDATKLIELARQMFGPNNNIGIATGAISGLVVVDFDVKSGGLDTFSLLEKTFPKTLRVATGGGGIHLYYKYPTEHKIRNKTGLFQGVDIRADGGYVVAPPSSTTGPYTWVNEDTPIVDLPSWLLAELIEPSYIENPLKPTKLAITGQLSKSTLDFLLNGAPKGTWNHRLFKAAKDYQEQGLSKEDFIERAQHITGYLDNNDLATIESAYKQQPKYSPRIANSEALKDLILSSYLITDIADSTNKVFVDLEQGKIHNIDPAFVRTKLSKDEREDYLNNRAIEAVFEYNPRTNKPIETDPATGIHIYNWYNPPEWKKDYFFFGNDIPKVDKLPEIYDQFLNHLTNNHAESKEYILDWVAHSLKSRNFTILTAIGEEGIGKGILATIFEFIHGKHNFAQCTDTVFKEKFNGKLQNKTLVYIDEVALDDKASHDRVKAVVNDVLEIEKKGENAVTSKNFASFYITSNHLDAVKIGPEDRRYSIIQLTDKKLKDTELRHVINSEILNESNLTALARYLYHRNVTFDMLKPFRSQRFQEILDAGLTQWEEWFLDEFLTGYRAGDQIDIKFAQDEIKEACGLKAAPSRRKIEALRRRYPDRFSCTQSYQVGTQVGTQDRSDRNRRKIKVL